ncbi:nucleotidyltransferase domain-containing protein [Ferdinandcohnia quinoae]|uniref:Nucleotidyltransferase domain-containing protein n=1 Tax=Fredinandcohnia quinoae TaxID=2918902 RepID=A0AAW5DY86_9BACI|nr:nucleotidyltransferase domain-containing protein [Fredinandcohnia sp. SECRCQ15]MCH1624284.1 nucleotidyltransferase domain-containing protein [Fredinandcohnia sp. SECRCQ15]
MIPKKVLEQLQHIGQTYKKIDEIILFGSRAYGDYSDRSDIDLAIVAPDIPAKEWLELVFELEEDLYTLLLLDIVKFDEASDSLKTEILKSGKVLYKAVNEKYQ